MRLGYGQGFVDIPDSVSVEIVLPEELPKAGGSEIENALDHPLGKSLSDLRGRSASLLVSDITRPSPSHLLLPPLVKRLREIGVSDIKVVFGLGTHRRMAPEEEDLLLKDCVCMPHIQHDPEKCLRLGETKRGTPVEIFEEVASSDLIIATGNIEYHYYAGYSGGAKALLPGVSSERSVVKNHELMRDPSSISGRLDSPVRQDMEEAAKIAGLDFILNVVLNSRKEIVRAVAGDFVEAHRSGADVVDHMYRKLVNPAEIVVTCAGGRPKDINLFQAHKALDNARGAAAPGGTIILLAECSEGFGNPVFERWACEAKSAKDCIDRFGREYEFGGHKAALIARESLEHNLILVSAMPFEQVEKCFFKPAKTLDEALAMAWDRHGKDARTLVMPHGNLTLATK
ncbi:MAG TPA: nickel-dependent lactate racemase [Methanotrichaceae archaeon]|nr:nickel-dependent lactate racemase [Methanotrichaceae archaeon]